ncbi:hypothetical protein H9P43_007459 [Blastocladiella emersonii ATCC 22665]|nr:hypothetical protein H9P43_007459 [Blastocladiella emersonii ATCC 22665]
MAERTALASNSPQFAYLEYFLQLSLRASSARIVAAHALSNPHVTVQFEKRCHDILTLDTWVDTNLLPASNSEEEVLRRGFAFNNTVPGLKVGIGSLKVSHLVAKDRGANGTTSGPAGKNIRKAILCKIGIGRAYINSPDGAARDPLPDGYDSWYLPLENDSIVRQAADGDEAKYYHEYFLTNAAQVLPMYLVQYEYDPEKERKLHEKPSCDNCETALAEFYCAADSANLCKSCDHQLHSANKLVSRHVRTPIGKGADVFGHCRHHPEKLIEFFCSQCHVPVCVYCKMVGHHAAGEAAKHKLVSVGEAYTTVMAESQLTDNILTSRKQAIQNQVVCLSARSKALDKHAAVVQQHIDDIYKKATADLAAITQAKRNVLASDECELHRQLEEILRLERFLAYQQAGDATQFLFSWARHQQLRQELHDFKFFRDSIDVQLDIKCSGGISVLVDNGPSGAAGSPMMTPTKGLMASIPLPGSTAASPIKGLGGMRGGGGDTATMSPGAVAQHARNASVSGAARAQRMSSSSTLSYGGGGAGGAAGGNGGGMMVSDNSGSSGSLNNSGNAPRNSSTIKYMPSPARGGSHHAHQQQQQHGRRSPGDYFSEALGALDDLSMAPGAGQGGGGAAGGAHHLKDFMSEFSFAEGEGYISD